MPIYIPSQQSISGSIRLPASKSYSIRALMIAACGGVSSLRFVSDCEDAKVALRLARQLGAKVKIASDTIHIDAKSLSKPSQVYQVGESGTSLRFLLPILAVKGLDAEVKGEGTLIGRPNHFLCESLRQAGVNINGEGSKESVPISLKKSILSANRVNIDGSISSQFISGLLIALALRPDGAVLYVKGKMVSVDYIEMTEHVLALTGIKIKRQSERQFHILPQQQYKGLKMTIPSDYGLAAFALALASLLPSRVDLKGYFNDDFIQADGHILPMIEKMGVNVKRSTSMLSIKGPFVLKGGQFDLKNCPDLVPIMTVLAMFAKGPTTLKGIAHARVKESDRVGDLSAELKKVGAIFKISENKMTIYPQHVYKQNILLSAHKDHRLAMAFTVLGAKIGCRLDDLQCTHKSYPAFKKDMQTLGLQFNKIKD